MERKVLLVCTVLVFLGLLSAATSFAAEGTRIKASQVQFVSATQCSYPRSSALPLGLTGALALMMAHIVINVSNGCICCRRNPRVPDSTWRLALVCFVLSWFTFVIAFLLLLTGAALNDQHGEEGFYFGSYNCYVVKPGVFAGGAVLSLASVTFGLVYYLSLSAAKNGNPWGDSSFPNHGGGGSGGIAMGQPQFPPQAQTNEAPVFVHEDTYMRRQFT